MIFTVSYWSRRGWPRPAAASAQFVPRQTIAGGYWSLEPGVESALMLSNTSPEPTGVYPQIFNAAGESVELPMMALKENQRQQLNLRDWLAENGVPFSSGSLRFRHTGRFLALAAQVTVTEESRSLSFDFPIEPRGLFYHWTRLDGLWWRQEESSRARLIVWWRLCRPAPGKAAPFRERAPRFLAGSARCGGRNAMKFSASR